MLLKEGMYYYLNDCGYTQNPLLAELYEKDYAIGYAERGETIEAVPVSAKLSKNDLPKIQQHIENMTRIRDFIKEKDS